DDAVASAIERLSVDPVPKVKFQIAVGLTFLYYTAPTLMWSLLEQMSAGETSTGVLVGLLHGSLDRLAPYHPDRIAQLTLAILDRVRSGEGSDEVRRGCARILGGLYIWQSQELCRETVDTMVTNPVVYDIELHEIVFQVRDNLNLALADPRKPNEDEV